MLNNKVIVLAILLVGLLAISAVSAETDALGDIAGTDSSTEGVENTDETILSSSSTDELENDNDPLAVDADPDKLEMGPDEVLGDEINVTGDSFDDISQAIGNAKDGDTIYLQGKTYKCNGEQISIDKNLTIIGGFEWGDGEYATLDAQKLSRIFGINAHVTLQGIKFINGAEYSGGAVYVDGGCTLIDCIFTNNTAAMHGGAVYWVTNAVGITNCTFENNHAEWFGGANYFNNAVNNVNLTGNFNNNAVNIIGGANYFEGAVTNVTLTGNFINNAAYYSGGANCFNDAVNNVTLTGNFTNNHAENGDGGANYFLKTVDNVNLTANFNNNTAHREGGANYFEAALNNVNLTGNFTNNCVKTKRGGANYFNNAVSNVTLTGDFNNNTAYLTGGANYFNDAVNNVTLTGNFTNNHAENGDGGANYFKATVNNVNLTGNFTNNRAKGHGGANCFVNQVDNVILTGNFTNNSAQSGGANKFNGAVTDVTLTGTFTDNTAEIYDGGANCFGDVVTNVTLTGNFTNNHAERGCGGANCFGDVVTNVTLTGNFTNNHAETGNGGANCFNNEVNNVALTGNFTNNHADGSGGANLFLREVTDVTLTGNYINNTGENVINIYDSGSGNVIRDSIFINNAPINVENGNITAVDNWFGNNVTNYNVKPEVGIDLDNWLFLNGTADPNSVSVADTSNIVFILSRYDGNNVSSYDNSRLIPIKLDITSTLGSVNPNPVNLNESITYTPERGGTGSVTASFENVQCTIEINNDKLDPGLSMDPQEIAYSNNTVIALNFNDSATGTVNITLKGNRYNKTYENLVLNATILLEGDILPDEYDVTVIYSGDEIFINASCNSKLKVVSSATVIIAEKEFDILATDYNAGERGHLIYATLADEMGNPLFNKTIQIAINGVIYYVKTNEDGLAGIQINLASANTYTCAWFFQGDELYNASLLASSKIVISKKPITISASNCVFKASAKTKTVTAKISTTPNPYDGKTYLAKNKLVTLTLNGRIYNARTDENGEVKFNIEVTKKGTYNAVIRFAGDRTYNGASKTIKITLDDKGASTSQKFGAKAEVLASSTDADVIPTSNFVPSKNTTVIDVAKEFTRVACDYAAGERGDYFYAILKDSNGNLLVNKTVQIAVNGPIYNMTTDENGTVGLMVNLASANTYTYALAFSGDKDCNAAPLACSKLIVTKKPITIAAKDCSFKADAKTKTVTATLKTSANPYDGKTYLSSGKKVTLKVNGNTYSGTIDGSGKVIFNVKLAKKGTYNAVISFSGDQTYEAAEKTVKITVK